MSKIIAPKMVYIKGEEMTRYGMELILEKWIKPNIDISAWEFYDLSCKHRDDTKDQVLKDVVAAGKKVKAIFKEPTITPTEEQKNQMGLSKAWGSPNGAMRRGWNGISISRDTIHIEGIELGYKKPVLFDRQAVGGEYGGGYGFVGVGKSVTTFYPEDGSEPVIIDERELKSPENSVVTYHNPLTEVNQLAHHFFARALEAKVTPYICTKKTVFKWQEPFWQIHKDVFDTDYKQKFREAGLLPQGELQHVISDAACMKLIAWKDGGYAMVAHNYDGDMLTDLMSQVHKSPGFISSILNGVADDGSEIKEFEASHGTVSDMYRRHKQGTETSLNPLGLVVALIGAMNHSEKLAGGNGDIKEFTDELYKKMCKLMANGKGTRDLCGATGLTTEGFVDAVAAEISSQ